MPRLGSWFLHVHWGKQRNLWRFGPPPELIVPVWRTALLGILVPHVRFGDRDGAQHLPPQRQQSHQSLVGQEQPRSNVASCTNRHRCGSSISSKCYLVAFFKLTVKKLRLWYNYADQTSIYLSSRSSWKLFEALTLNRMSPLMTFQSTLAHAQVIFISNSHTQVTSDYSDYNGLLFTSSRRFSSHGSWKLASYYTCECATFTTRWVHRKPDFPDRWLNNGRPNCS